MESTLSLWNPLFHCCGIRFVIMESSSSLWNPLHHPGIQFVIVGGVARPCHGHRCGGGAGGGCYICLNLLVTG